MTQLTQTLGFIGAGRMATALARGCVGSGLVSASQVLAADPQQAAREQFGSQVPQAMLNDSNAEVLAKADLVVLAVKPQVMADVLQPLAKLAKAEHLFVSIAAGVTLEKLANLLPHGKLIRVMPNTPCLIGEGASCFSLGRDATDHEGYLVRQILESVGIAHQVEEPLLDAVTGLSGSGPAFVYTMIEALAAGGAEMGLPAALALQLATQTARGAAGMLAVTGSSPAELREQVTSPGGTTLAGLETLGKLDGAAAFREAVMAATRRSVELGK